MQDKYPRLSAKEAETLLLQKGFSLVRQKGSHRIYRKGNIRMIIPFHSGKVLHPKIAKEVYQIIEDEE